MHSDRRGGEIGRAFALATALGLVLLWGALADWHRLGSMDWNAAFGQAQAAATSLRDYGQFPFWNPWRAGGEVAFAEPESMLLSPVTPLSLLFGVPAAFKLLLLPLFVAGFLGMHTLAAQLGLRGLARLMPPLTFFGSSIFPLYVVGGLPNWLFGIAILPWLVLAYRRGIEDRRWLVLAAVLYAALLFCGDVHHFVFFPIFLMLDAACLSLSRKSLRPLLALAMALLLGALLASVRLLPLAEVYREFPREVPPQKHAFTPADLALAFLEPAQGPSHAASWTWRSSYVGPLAVVLALVGAVAAWRRTWVLAIPAVVFAWMALGTAVHPSLWQIVHVLPVVHSMRAPDRLILFVAFCAAVLAGFGFDATERALLARWPGAGPVIAGSLVALGVLPTLIDNAPISREAFTLEPSPSIERQEVFRQAWTRPRPGDDGGELYESVLANQGNVIGHTDIPRLTAARPYTSPDYKGEVYLLSGEGEVAAELTPNRIQVRAEVKREGDLLIVNQNYFPGWRAQGTVSGPLQPHKGLLSLALPGGPHAVTLIYRPAAFGYGLVLSLLGGLAAAAYLKLGGGLVERLGQPAGPSARAGSSRAQS